MDEKDSRSADPLAGAHHYTRLLEITMIHSHVHGLLSRVQKTSGDATGLTNLSDFVCFPLFVMYFGGLLIFINPKWLINDSGPITILFGSPNLDP